MNILNMSAIILFPKVDRNWYSILANSVYLVRYSRLVLSETMTSVLKIFSYELLHVALWVGMWMDRLETLKNIFASYHICAIVPGRILEWHAALHNMCNE